MDDTALRQASILVVDGDQASALLLEAILADAGYANVAAATEAGTVERLFDHVMPDLLVVDLQMPGCDGAELASGLRESSERLFQVLIVSTDASVAARRRAFASGAADFLVKPYDREQALLRIAGLLRVQLLRTGLFDRSAQLERRIAERAELGDSRVALLDTLAIAAELRDDRTGEHTRRVGRTAGLLAHRMGLAGDESAVIERTAPLHDIGKVAIPDRILLKPGPLSADEYELIKGHTNIGASILSAGNSALLRTAEEIARSHHERWDGGGYPEGLRDESIPLSGRVVAVADVFDALTHDRPYKVAWPLDQAVFEVGRQRGRQFDPDVVDAFEELDHQQLVDPSVAGPRFQRNGRPAELRR